MVKFRFVGPLCSSSHSMIDEVLDVSLESELIFVHVVNFGDKDVRNKLTEGCTDSSSFRRNLKKTKGAA